MKTNKFFRFLTLAMCAVAFAFVTGCEGPEGAQGPKGDTGAQGDKGDKGDKGDQGDDGTPGVAGNVTCLECHSADTPQNVKEQFHRSAHAAGAIAVDYAGGRSSCARCHSHEGYLEFARTGTVAENITNPSAWQCKTCHNIHTTFESADYAFRLGDAVTLLASGTVVDAANNNTCINCHQARRGYEYYDGQTEDKQYTRTFTGDDANVYNASDAIGPAGTKTYWAAGAAGNENDSLIVVFDVPFATHAYISSTHAGPHHGPQGNLWAGTGGVQATDVIFDAHKDGCVKCHMGPESGHSFIPKMDNCQVSGCHSGSKQPSLDAFLARIVAVGMKLDELHAVHFDQATYDEVLDDTDSEAKAYYSAFHPMYSSLERDVFQAWWNFALLLEDRSQSAHNPTYAESLLSDAETKLGL